MYGTQAWSFDTYHLNVSQRLPSEEHGVCSDLISAQSTKECTLLIAGKLGLCKLPHADLDARHTMIDTMEEAARSKGV